MVIDPLLAGRVALSAARLQSGEFWPGAHLGLTQRESEVLELMVRGHHNRAIARELILGRGDGEEPRRLDLPQARGARPHPGRRDGAARRAVPLSAEERTPVPGDRAAGAGRHEPRHWGGGDRALGGDRLLRQIIEVVSADLDLGGMAQRVAELVTETTGCDVCFVHVLDEDRSLLTLEGATPPFDRLAGTRRARPRRRRVGLGRTTWRAGGAPGQVDRLPATAISRRSRVRTTPRWSRCR